MMVGLKAFELLKRLSATRGLGPIPYFSEFHVWKAMWLVKSRGPIGRHALGKALKLGEGSTRRLLDRLKEEEIVETSRRGCLLTSKGGRTFQELSKKIAKIARVDASDLTVGKIDVAILVKGSRRRVTKGVQQRDAAIRTGAEGATTLLYSGGRLIAPTIGKALSGESNLAKQIFSLLPPTEDDVIVIGTADSEDKAEKGAWAAAITLV